jgi:two-component system sensor kinase FixL
MASTHLIKLIVQSTALATLIFAFDLLLPLGVAGGVPYVALVLHGNWYPRKAHIFALAMVGTFLTLLGFFLSPSGGILWVVMTNRAVALFAIWITAILIANWKQAEAELRVKEEELRRVSRLGDMGQVTAALAHELGQPLTAFGNYIQAARRLLERGDMERSEKVHDNLDKAVAQGARAADIVRNLRTFVQKGETELADLDANAVVEEAISIALPGTARDGIGVTQNLGQGLVRVVANRVQIQQVMVNLLRNSVDAMAASKRREITVTTSMAGGEGVEIAVADTGPGLPEEVSSQLFKPFVTTKPDGMGIGLSICRSIIDEHGGRLWADENPGGGTLFRFTLPVVGGKAGGRRKSDGK